MHILHIERTSNILTLQPIQQDYSDVYNVMAFFVGPPVSDLHGLHVESSRGHDDLAQKIGENAEQFVRTMWRWEDLQVYVCLSCCCVVNVLIDPFRCIDCCLSMRG